jgi:circadian clock protein KaiB
MRKSPSVKFVFKLFISGTTLQSQKALTNFRKICEAYLDNNYDLEVIDVYQNPKLAKDEHIIAVPTLLKKAPAPMKKFIGDLADEIKIVQELDLKLKSKVKRSKKKRS